MGSRIILLEERALISSLKFSQNGEKICPLYLSEISVFERR
jgi:hypothetical protein